MSQQTIIGITGGIATGKSTVADYLARTYGLPVLDADRYARDAIDAPMRDRLVQHFGTTILHPDGTLNRAALGEIVFRDPAERAWLEAQIHPYVRDRLQREAAALAPAAVVMAIPLLFEANMTDLVSEVWVVTCPEAVECARLVARDRLSEAQARARMASQMPLADKTKRADVVLDNGGTLAALYAQIDRIMGDRGIAKPAGRRD